MAQLGDTELDVFPLCLGCNVFGWTTDEREAFAVLDAYAAAGGNFLDTADAYPPPGDTNGECERIIGRWLRRHGDRDRMIIATKVGRMPGLDDLRANTIRTAVEGSLRRLQVDSIDLYYAHGDDHPDIPIEETVGAFDALVQSGEVRYTAASNYDEPRLAEALKYSGKHGLARYAALQPEYNLMERDYEQNLARICEDEGLACVPYFSLAWGFLTGKYRPGISALDGPRRESAERYLDDRGLLVLRELDAIAERHHVPVAAVALAWLLAQPTVVAPIASARTPEQLADLLPMVALRLDDLELIALSNASRRRHSPRAGRDSDS